MARKSSTVLTCARLVGWRTDRNSSCQMSARPRPALASVSEGENRSGPDHGFGGDHSRFGLKTDGIEGTNDVKQVTRGHLVPTGTLHAEPGQQRHERRIAKLCGPIDLAAPRTLALQRHAETIGEAAGRAHVEPVESRESGNEEARLALARASIFADEVLHGSATHLRVALWLCQHEQRPGFAAFRDRRAPAHGIAVKPRRQH